MTGTMPVRTIASLLLLIWTCAGCGTEDSSRDAGGEGWDWIDPGDGSTEDAAPDPDTDAECQPPTELTLYMTMVPFIEDGEFTETGTVQSLDVSDPDQASFTVLYLEMTGFPQEQTYTVPLLHGRELDLDVGDTVRTRFEKDLWDEWVQTGLHVERDGVTVLFYMHCLHHCTFAFMETHPLLFEVLAGACPAEEDPMGCAMVERTGYRVTCPGTSESVDVFDHNAEFIDCDSEYLVIVEDHNLVREHLMTCAGMPDNRIRVVLLRVR